MEMTPILLVVAAYAAGSVPASFWIGKAFYGKDLRTLGSGNLGGTNAWRMLGWKAGVPVMALDIFKGFAPVWWFPLWDGQTGAGWAVAYAAAAIVGHVFSFWAGFRGGKGVATTAGALMALMPSAVAAGVVVFALVLLLTRIVSASSIVAALAVPVWAFLVPGTESALRAFQVFAGLFIVWAHRSNIRRVLAGTEARLGREPAARGTGTRREARGSGEEGGGEG